MQWILILRKCRFLVRSVKGGAQQDDIFKFSKEKNRELFANQVSVSGKILP